MRLHHRSGISHVTDEILFYIINVTVYNFSSTWHRPPSQRSLIKVNRGRDKPILSEPIYPVLDSKFIIFGTALTIRSCQQLAVSIQDILFYRQEFWGFPMTTRYAGMFTSKCSFSSSRLDIYYTARHQPKYNIYILHKILFYI